MTPKRLAIALIASIIGIGIASAKIIHFADQARDPGVNNWIWYQVLGPRNSPYSILYVSPQNFETYIGEHLIVLPLPTYNILSSYTKSRIARSDCPGDKALAMEWYTVQIAEHDRGHTRQCVLPKHSACKYLSGVGRLRGVNWTAAQLRQVKSFINQIRCGTPQPGK
jgi:hypothetical protein